MKTELLSETHRCDTRGGWLVDAHFAEFAQQYPEEMLGRVVAQQKGAFTLVCERGEFGARVSGKFRHAALEPAAFPAVGDYVMFTPTDGEAVVYRLLPRRSAFLRRAAGTQSGEQVVAANIDTAFLCMSLNNDFNLRRMERYLALSWDSGAVPVIVLTKADLCGDIAEKRAALGSIAAGVDIVVCSAFAPDVCSQLASYLTPGKTVVFVGSSGTGKSTLINRLLGESQLRTDGLRKKDRGKHTTTHREMFRLPGGALVVDTPGMRELGMREADKGIDAAFEDIEKIATDCRCSDCTHTGEPGCAVRAALDGGTLSAQRVASYQKLKAENEYAANTAGYLAAKRNKANRGR